TGCAGVTSNGDINLAAGSATLRVRDALTLNGTATLSGSSCRLVFDNSATFNGNGTVLFTGNLTHDVAVDGTSTLTIGPGITIRGDRGSVGGVLFYQRAPTPSHPGTDLGGTPHAPPRALEGGVVVGARPGGGDQPGGPAVLR